MKPSHAAVLAVLVVLGATVAAQGFFLRRQDQRLRDLESAQARLATPEGVEETLRRAGIDPARVAGASTPAAVAAEAAARRAAVDAAVAAQTTALEERLASLEKSTAALAAGGAADGDALDAVVAKKVEEKMGGKKKDGIFGDEKKRPLTEISKDLELTEPQEDQMAAAIDASQKKVFDLITTPRNDGTNLLDDLAEALKDPEHAQEKAQAVFLQLFTAKIPGSDETYLAKIMTEKVALNEEFRKVLTPEQMKKYERLGQDPHEIQTGYDPYGEYLVERMGK